MAQQSVSIGSSANDGTGDPLRTAFTKINANFTELYGSTAEANDIIEDTSPQLGGDLDVSTFDIVSVSDRNIDIDPNGTGTIELKANTNITGNLVATGDITANGNINLGDAAGDQVKVTGVFEADQLQIDGTTLTSTVTNGFVTIQGHGTGGVNIDNLIFNNTTISSTSNADITLTPDGTGSVVMSAIKVFGTTISSDDSTQVTIAEALQVNGAATLGTSLALATGATVTGILDEDAMGTDSATQLATQQSIKTYADTKAVQTGSTNNTVTTVTGANTFQGETNLTFNGSTLAVTGAGTFSTSLGVTGTLTTADITTTGTHTITGQADIDAIRVKDNKITTNSTNANLELAASGTGVIDVQNAMTTLGQTITGVLTVDGSVAIDNININGNTITGTNSNGGIVLQPNGTGTVMINGDSASVSGRLDVLSLTVNSDLFMSPGAKISPFNTNQDVIIETNGTGSVVLDQVSITDNTITTHVSNADLRLDTDGTGYLDILTDTQTTVGSAGGASALPGVPTGYVKIKIGGTLRVIPFWDQA